MPDIVKPLVDRIVPEMRKLLEPYSDEQRASFVNWAFGDFQRFMLIPRENYIDTFNIMLAKEKAPPEQKAVFQFLKDNINEYGATQAYYRMFAILKEEL